MRTETPLEQLPDFQACLNVADGHSELFRELAELVLPGIHTPRTVNEAAELYVTLTNELARHSN